MTPADTATVNIVDDDDLVRASIQGMLKSVGLRSQAFADPAGVSAQPAFGRSELPDS